LSSVWPGIAAVDAANASKTALKLLNFMVFLPVFPASAGDGLRHLDRMKTAN